MIIGGFFKTRVLAVPPLIPSFPVEWERGTRRGYPSREKLEQIFPENDASIQELNGPYRSLPGTQTPKNNRFGV